MHWLFLVPLSTGLAAGYLSFVLMDEIAYLTGAFALVSLLLCLLMAPWQMQLGVLVVGLIIARLFWTKLNDKITAIGHHLKTQMMGTASEDPHQRTYRGISYQTETLEDVSSVEMPKEGTYRGLPWKSENIAVKSEGNTKFIRKYRGIPLSTPDSHPET